MFFMFCLLLLSLSSMLFFFFLVIPHIGHVLFLALHTVVGGV